MHFKTQHHHPEFLRGFTLIELMVTIAVLGVFVSLALPSFQELIQSNRIQSTTAEFQSALAMARGEAIKRGGDSKVTILANTANGTTSWNNGYTVFVDRTGSGSTLAQLATESTAAAGSSRNELLLNIPANTAVSFTENDNTAVNYVTYNGMGRSVQTNNAQLFATYRFMSATGQIASTSRCIYMSSIGRTRSERYSASDFANLTTSNTCPFAAN
jgi:prepilin-type N-terminal cleavage/methylation domain-containing protein